jgi:O-antigen/teichoic acid export membrane protein
MAMRRSMAWMAGGQAAFFIFQFAGSVVIARLLSPYDVGVFTIAMAVVGLVAIVQSVGLNSYLVRERELSAQTVSTAATINWILAFVIACLIALIGLVGEYFFQERGVREVLLVIAFVPLIGAITFVPVAMLEREGNFRALALVRIASTAFGLMLTIFLAVQGFRYMSLAYSQIATTILTNIIFLIVARRHLNFRLSLIGAREIAKYALQILTISGLGAVTVRCMDIVLGRLQGLHALGLYSRASGSHNMLWDSVHMIMARVAFVDFARHVADGGSLRERYLKVLESITGLLWPLFGCAAILAGPLVHMIFGEAWIGAAAPLALLCIASIIFTSIAMNDEIFVICHETGLQVRLMFIKTIVAVTLFVAGALHSLEAAAASRIGEALFMQFLNRPYLHRMIKAEAGDFKGVYVRSAIAAIAASTPPAALMIHWHFSTSVPIEQFILSCVCSAVLWLLALRFSGHFLFEEILRMMSKLYRKPQVN